MWLAISRENEISSYWENPENKIQLKLYPEINSDLIDQEDFIRVSQIFPLNKEDQDFSYFDNDYIISFYFFPHPGEILSKLSDREKIEKLKVYYGFGLCSIIVVSRSLSSLDILKTITSQELIMQETWHIVDSRISESEIQVNKNLDTYSSCIIDYTHLTDTIQDVIEELHLSFKSFSSKVKLLPSSNTFPLHLIESEINDQIKGITKHQIKIDHTMLHSPIEPTNSVDETADWLNEKADLIDSIISSTNNRNQYLDNAIQLLSSLSYVSTQTFSGLIPVLSRRSLLRRHSLLGIGSCILGLNKLKNHIEQAFLEYDYVHKIIHRFNTPKTYLSGIKKEPPHSYDSSKWQSLNIDQWSLNSSNKISSFKLPFFSARLGFRESEYAISAAIQSITNGSNREWSILTITHELMHAQVRLILNSIIAGKPEEESESANDSKSFDSYFEIYSEGFKDHHSLLDSIKYVLILHCCMSDTFGSLTKSTDTPVISGTDLKSPEDMTTLYELLADNFRNINEVFVHLFDFKYIYRGQQNFYIKSIWHSWSSLPHIDADIRQYVLRSLIVICSDVTTKDPFKRYEESLSILRNCIVDLYNDTNKPFLLKVLKYITGLQGVGSDVYSAFFSYLILVDMICNIFISKEIASVLYDDPLVEIFDDEMMEELDFKYIISDDFSEDTIKSPIAFLIHKMRGINPQDDIDYRDATCRMILAIL